MSQLVTLVPLIAAFIGAPGAYVLYKRYKAGATTPKDQAYYETLISRSWASEERIRVEFERESAKREALEKELDAQRAAFGKERASMRRELEKCKQRCSQLEHRLRERADEIDALRRVLAQWKPEEGGAGAG